MKEKKGHRSDDQTQISLSLPVRLLEKVNALAVADGRSRSNWIVRVIARKVEADEARKALESGATHAPDFHSTARATHSLSEDPATPAAVPPRANTPAPLSPTHRAIRSMVKKEKPKP